MSMELHELPFDKMQKALNLIDSIYSACENSNTPPRQLMNNLLQVKRRLQFIANAILPVCHHKQSQYTDKLQTYDKFREYYVCDGDTLQKIAARELNNPELWTLIADYNQLSPFDILTPGQKIFIPDRQELPKYVIENNFVLDYFDGEQLYGTNLAWENDDLAVDVNGNLKTISGIDNLKQALYIALNTEIGSLEWHRDYGTRLKSMIGGRGSQHEIEMLKTEILRTIKTDVRIKEAKITDFKQFKTQINITITIIPHGAKEEITEPMVVNV